MVSESWFSGYSEAFLDGIRNEFVYCLSGIFCVRGYVAVECPEHACGELHDGLPPAVP